MNDDFSKVVGMPSPSKESNIADRTVATMSSTESVLLNIWDALHNETDRPEDDARDVSTRSKLWLIESSNLGRVQDGNW